MPREDLLTSAEQALLSARADAFHSALRKGTVADWHEHLEGLEGPVRTAVLVELVILDMGHRWRHGDGLSLEEYAARFPELGPPDDLSPKLITEEFRCRVAAGENPDLSLFRSRFPIQFSAIRSQLTAMIPQEAAPAASMPGPSKGTAVGGVAGEFEFIRKLGQGVFGEVWLAKKKTSGIEKAIKILLQAADHEAAIRELRSLELIKNLRHPYLLATEDFWISGDRLHVVMELAEGTLRGRMKECQATGLPGIPEPELFRFFSEAAEGLDYLHEQKITHRDVKPDNILILRGHTKVADFGLARMQDQIMSQMSVFAGTPAYMAPEVWGGEGGPASDQYSLASTYIELRQGKSALKLGPMAEMMIAHMDGHFTFADFIPEAEQDVLRQAMAKEPEDRYANCVFFMEALAMASGRSVSRFALTASRTGPGSNPSLKLPKERSGPIPVSGARTWGGSMAGSLGDPANTYAPSDTNVASKPIPKAPTKTMPKFQPKSPGVPKVAIAGFLILSLLGSIVAALVIFGGSGGGTATSAEEPTKPGTEATTPATNEGPPPPPKPMIGEKVIAMPGKAKRDDSAELVRIVGERWAYEWVTVAVGPETMRFRLIPGGAEGNVKPFYISEYKVWVGLYRAGNGAPIRDAGLPKPSDGEPQMNVTAIEAAAFAANIALGEGALPTPAQWDHAAGLFRTPPRAEIAVAGSSPIINVGRPVATRGKVPIPDANDVDLKDMAGNGREWTSGVFGVAEAKKVFAVEDRVILRGRNFTLPTALTFDKLKLDRDEPQAAFAGKPSPYTGFRVVLLIP